MKQVVLLAFPLAALGIALAAEPQVREVTFAKADAAGKLTTVAQVPTIEGARNGVIADDGSVTLASGKAGALVVVPLPAGF